MEKLTVESLKQFRDKLRKTMRVEDTGKNVRITVHMGTCGLASGAQEIYDTLLKLIQENKADWVNVTAEDMTKEDNPTDLILATSGCAGMCCNEPMITVKLAGRPGVKYKKLTAKKTEKIFKEHVLEGNVVKAYAVGMGPEAIY